MARKGIFFVGFFAGMALVAFLSLLVPDKPCPLLSPTELQEPIDTLLDAIEWVESKGDANAVGDNGKAVGSFQLHKIYVEDVNRILIGWKRQLGEQIKEAGGKGLGGWFIPYTYKDRFDRRYSREMSSVYLMYYNPSSAENEIEAMARIHNGGPDGWKKECTKPYWEKVKARLNSPK